MLRIGVLSDTHGLLRDEALEALRGSDYIVHAGDVGDPEIVERLEEIAPVTVVRGNTDHGAWALRLPLTDALDAGEVQIYVLHILEHLDLDPASAGFDAVVYGHTHEPAEERRAGVLYLNPGSCGPRRFRLPVTVARLTVQDGAIQVEFVDLEQTGPTAGGTGPPGTAPGPAPGSP